MGRDNFPGLPTKFGEDLKSDVAHCPLELVASLNQLRADYLQWQFALEELVLRLVVHRAVFAVLDHDDDEASTRMVALDSLDLGDRALEGTRGPVIEGD